MRNNVYLDLPKVKFNRSKFDLSHKRALDMNIGDVVPLDVVEVLPGDTFINKTTAVVRSASGFIKPIMDNLYLDIRHFYVRSRLLYDDFEKVFGNPSPSQYINEEYANVPFFSDVIAGGVNINSINVYSHSVLDYLGYPVGRITAECTPLLARGFALIYNQWYRDQNVINETYVYTGESNVKELPNFKDWSEDNYVGKLPKARKRADYFVSALPNAQKGEPVALPTASGLLPVQTLVNGNLTDNMWLARDQGAVYMGVPTQSNDYPLRYVGEDGGASFPMYFDTYVDISKGNFGTINDLRTANALQKYLERASLFGSRYTTEYIPSAFGVETAESVMFIPEYIGGGRISLNIQQVNQTSSSNGASNLDNYLANVGAYSLSNGFSKYSKGFTEHGYVYTIGVIRQIHTYSQGLPCMMTRRTKNDYYDTAFANIGYQPIYQKEIYAHDNHSASNDVFGYKEAWAEYRTIPNSVAGGLRPTVDIDPVALPLGSERVSSPFNVWTLADDYVNAPVLSPSFVQENDDNLARALIVPPSEEFYPFVLDFWHDLKAVRVMPVYSTPSFNQFK